MTHLKENKKQRKQIEEWKAKEIEMIKECSKESEESLPT